MAIRKAELKQYKMPILLQGSAGSGKSYSSLLLANGIVNGDMSKVVVIDSENGRGELYARDELLSGYMVRELGENNSPQQFIKAIEEAEDYGAEVIIIDGASPEWNGTGGVLRMAGSSSARGIQKWTEPKMEHNRFIQKITGSSAFVIVTCRDKDIMDDNFKKTGDKALIQSGEFSYEFLLVIRLENTKTQMIKNPSILKGMFKDNEIITKEHGSRFLEWFNGNPEVEYQDIKKQGSKVAEKGVEELRGYYKGLSTEVQGALKDYFVNVLNPKAELHDNENLENEEKAGNHV